MDALLYDVVSKCKLCPNLGMDHVPAAGDPEADIMLIGQSPGAQEVEAKSPFVGPCGELLDYLLDEAGLDRNDIYITNCVKCRPPGNRPGLAEEIKLCTNTWLKKEIKLVKPKIILVIGKDAFKSLNLHKRDKFAHNLVLRSNIRTYIVTYHPGFFLRSGSIERFVRIGQTLKEEYDKL